MQNSPVFVPFLKIVFFMKMSTHIHHYTHTHITHTVFLIYRNPVLFLEPQVDGKRLGGIELWQLLNTGGNDHVQRPLLVGHRFWWS